ncbi:hypothetical protein Tco_0020371 [Tanacetum coccineum]
MSITCNSEEKTNKKNDVKARSLLLCSPQLNIKLTSVHYTDAKSMFAAIETRFGGNATTKKTQKTLLKQQYESFSASSAESLDSIFNRLQKIISRLAILGVVIAKEDLNSKFLSNLPPEWNTHVVVWMNKPEVETMSIDDLYNNFKIVEQKKEIFVQVSSKVSTHLASLPVIRIRQIHEMIWKQNGVEVATSLASMKAKECDDLIVKLNQTEFTASTYKRGLAIVEEQLITYRKNEVLFSEKVAVLKREVACKDYEINVLKNNSKENSDESLVEEQVSQDIRQVNVVRAKGGKPQQDDKGFVDSGCSRHMTRNIAYLSDFKEFDEGYVAFERMHMV